MTAPIEQDGRRRRSLRTRARIVEAAAHLLVERGYLLTTIEAVADVAGVAEQTVYYDFGTKARLLSAVLDASIAGDRDPVPVLDQQWVDKMEDDPAASSAVERLVAESVAILSRTALIYEVVRSASAVPEVGALLRENRRRRHDDQHRLIDTLWRSGHLRTGVEVATAADVFYALMNEEVFQQLTVDRGWSVERFQKWATSLMKQQLVAAV